MVLWVQFPAAKRKSVVVDRRKRSKRRTRRGIAAARKFCAGAPAGAVEERLIAVVVRVVVVSDKFCAGAALHAALTPKGRARTGLAQLNQPQPDRSTILDAR